MLVDITSLKLGFHSLQLMSKYHIGLKTYIASTVINHLGVVDRWLVVGLGTSQPSFRDYGGLIRRRLTQCVLI